MAILPIYEFYAELADYEPKIWRRFQVLENVTVARLGYIVMTMFEMQASHLFQIEGPTGENFLNRCRHDERRMARMRTMGEPMRSDMEKINQEVAEKLGVSLYVIPPLEEDFPDPPQYHRKDATKEKLKHAVSDAGDVLCFQYDYGDGWEIHLRLEDVFIDEELPGRKLPRVMEGEGYGIIEDCGGPGGLADLARAFAKKKGTEYRELSQWLGQTMAIRTLYYPLSAGRELKVGRLWRIFDNMSESCKLFWFQAVLRKVCEERVQATFDELIDQMIVDAWYMVSEYRLNLGPANGLEALVHYIYEIGIHQSGSTLYGL